MPHTSSTPWWVRAALLTVVGTAGSTSPATAQPVIPLPGSRPAASAASAAHMTALTTTPDAPLVTAAALPAATGAPGNPLRHPLSPMVRPLVRPIDARDMLREGLERSATVRALVEALDRHDVVVLVELREASERHRGQLTWITAAGGVRYVRVTVGAVQNRLSRISMLAHELTHALEIAEAPEVRDVASLKAFYQRICCFRNIISTEFETQRAVDAGRRALDEVYGNRPVKPSRQRP